MAIATVDFCPAEPAIVVPAYNEAANVGAVGLLIEPRNYREARALTGMAVSVVWKYVMSSLFTWRRR